MYLYQACTRKCTMLNREEGRMTDGRKGKGERGKGQMEGRKMQKGAQFIPYYIEIGRTSATVGEEENEDRESVCQLR
jgi:hypothetical protein